MANLLQFVKQLIKTKNAQIVEKQLAAINKELKGLTNQKITGLNPGKGFLGFGKNKDAKLAEQIRNARLARSAGSAAELEFMKSNPELGTLLKSGAREFSSAEAKAGLNKARLKAYKDLGFGNKSFLKTAGKWGAIGALGTAATAYATPRVAVLAGDYLQDKDPILASKLYGFAPYADQLLTFNVLGGHGFGHGLMPSGSNEYLQEAIPAGIDPTNPDNINLGWGYNNVPDNPVYKNYAKDVAQFLSTYKNDPAKRDSAIATLTPEQKRRYSIAEGLRTQLGSVTRESENDNEIRIKDPYVWEPDDANSYEQKRVNKGTVSSTLAYAEQAARLLARYNLLARSSEDNTGYTSKRNTTKASKYRSKEEIAARRAQGVVVDDNDNEYFESQKLGLTQGVPVRRFTVKKK